MSNWKTYQLQDLCDFQNGFAFKNSDYIERSENSLEVLRMGYIQRGGGFKEDSSPVFIPSNYGKRLDKYLLKKGDIVMAMTDMKNSMAILGCSARIPASNRFVLNQRVGRIRVVNSEIVNETYLYYLLNSNKYISKLQSKANSGVQVNLSTPVIKQLEIRLPSLNEQNKVVDILTPLDQKIQLNTQINQTLEQIAQAVFKSWFIDFDPVRAKAAAKAQGATDDQAEQAAVSVISGKSPAELTAYRQTHPSDYEKLAQLARHFPSEFEMIDGVEVPKGWGIKLLPEIIDFLEGPGIRNWQYTDNEDGINFINIRCIQNSDLLLSSANKITKEEAFGKYVHFQLQENDIVISTSGTLGRSAIVRKEHLPLCLNTSVIRFRPIDNQSTFSFIYGFVNNQLQYELETRASGSVQKNFGPTHLKGISVLVPNFELLELHQEYLNYIFEKRKSNLVEIDFLSKIRDLLLPKLLSEEFKNE